MKSLLNVTPKLVLTLCCVLFILNTAAQNVNNAYKNAINSTFAGIDKTKVPHKLLIDYAMEFIDLYPYAKK